MQGCFPRIGAVLSVLATCLTVSAAEIPKTWIDDAQLHDVQQVGSKFAIAVGEHGAVWISEDGGRTWGASHCDLDVSLQSVCFLTDRIGWIAGSDIVPWSGQNGSVLLSTQDGGQTWQRLGRDVLPSLGYVKFFDMEQGLVVGQPTSLSPSGIFNTSDGGKTWQGVAGNAPQEWKAMCFLQPETGVVAGTTGRVALMGGHALHPSTLQPQGFRSIRGISLLPNDTGWLAGDGGMVLKTSTGGVVWEAPSTPLPEELRDGIDFRAVDVRDENVWLAGSPGSVVWHSLDSGRHWQKQLTGQASPLASIRFSNARQGIAVGALGVILRTDDGGTTWQAVRGGGRRAAVLSLLARPGRTSAAFLAKLSGESGFRSAVWILQREDLGPLAVCPESESLLHSAVQRCGGHSADVNWQLPLTLPGIEFSSDKLISAWQKQTEGRLLQTLLGAIVRQIRTWRPNIVVIDQPSVDDAVGKVLYDATLRAIGKAADETSYPEQVELTGLANWSVDRVYARQAASTAGDATIDLDEFLPYLKTSVRIAATTSNALLQAGRTPVSESTEASRIAYRQIALKVTSAGVTETESRGNNAQTTPPRDFFAGLSIAPGSAARRDMGLLDESNMLRMQKLVQKQRNFTSVFQKTLDDPKVAGQMIAQINGIVDGMESRQAVGLLRDLADEYRKRSQFELVESTYVELIRRYPEEPGSLDAMRWLIRFWSSSEMAWQRTRQMQNGTTISKRDSERHLKRVQQATGRSGNPGQLTGDSNEGNDVITASGTGSPMRLKPNLDFGSDSPQGKGPGGRGTKSNERSSKGALAGADSQGRLNLSRDTDWRSGAISEWHSRANELAKQLQITSPSLFQSPDVQFPLAAMRRSNGIARSADGIYRNFLTNAINVEMKELAERELWASFPTPQSPKDLVFCQRVKSPPHLDGLLSDPCWVDARDFRLTDDDSRSQRLSDGTRDSRNTMAMFAYDSEFLYVAFSVPRAEGPPSDGPQTTGRQHDADLSRHDRISIRLDIDRDYATWYEFQIDQRGCTSESCWEDRRWNPTWFVAAESDKTSWRVEAAIPWNDLTPTPPQRGTTYALSILRTIPATGLQSWTHPTSVRPQPSSFGLMKFQ